MEDPRESEYIALGEASSPKLNHFKKVSFVPLVFLIFYEVSGGPFGVEDTVPAAGPPLALLGFLLFPFIWSVPETLITAEMSTPCSQRVVALWFGSHQLLVLVGDFSKGLDYCGWVAILLGVFLHLPSVVMWFVTIPTLMPSRWLVVDLENVNWGLYLITLFWNLNYWDSISTSAGEVETPNGTLPKALFYALILVVFRYFFPALIGTGAVPVQRELWSDGYFFVIAKILGGVLLSSWIQGASTLSNMGMCVDEMGSDSFQLLGMAECGMLPEVFAKRSSYGIPLVGILFSASRVILLSWLRFQEIVAAENFLYCFGMIMEFIAVIKLRMNHPTVPRPYRIPVATAGATLICVPPTLLILVVLALASLKVMAISMVAVIIGLTIQPCMKHAEDKCGSSSTKIQAFQNFILLSTSEMSCDRCQMMEQL